VRTYWLSFHASYACRHSGACCSSGWDIPIEQTRTRAIEQAIGAGSVVAPAQWLRRVAEAPADVAGVLAVRDEGHCVFHQAPGCAIHTVLGHTAIPAACQHFPRIALIDPRGVFVTLSHYCPTAAGLLVDAAGPTSIVEGPDALPEGIAPEGLDARDALPPSESPHRLLDWDGYSAWERRAVGTLCSGGSPDSALDALDSRARRVPEGALLAVAGEAVPPTYSRPQLTPPKPSGPDLPPPVAGRYLAAHVFASWMAYQGNGLLATVLYLRTVLTVVRSELARGRSPIDAIRQADLLLRHLIDRQVLATGLSRLAQGAANSTTSGP
jgi:hypothetical protein